MELRCVFRNRGTTQVMWFRSSGEMISNQNSILSNASPDQGSYHLAGSKRRGEYFLVITNVQLEDADEYSCAYTKDNGDMDSRSAFLIVQSPPSAGYPMCSVEPESPRVGDYVTFTCLSEGGVPNANLAWYRNNMARTPITLKISSFRKVLKLDDMNAQFFCQADSPVEDSPRRCDVRPVQITPSVTMNPSELHGLVREELYVSCIRIDKPSQTNFMWFYNDDPIENLADSRRFQIVGNGDTLKITSLMRRDNDATIKCQLQIYKGFMKHASASISVEVSDLNNPVITTTSMLSSEKTDKDVVTSYSSDNANVTDILITLSLQGEGQQVNIVLLIVLLLIFISFIAILFLSLLFFKSVRNRKVTGNDETRGRRKAQRSNLRHVYETSFPVAPVENEAMLSGRGRATYQDHDAGMVDNQGVSHFGETRRHRELERYQSDPAESPTYPRDKMVPTNHISNGAYEIPLTDERIPSSSSSTSSPSTDGYVDIMKEDGQYDEFNHKSREPIHHRLGERGLKTKQDKKHGVKPVLRPVKSEGSIVDSLNIEGTQDIMKHISATSLSGEDETKPRKKVESPKNKRITPNSPPPTHLVPRPNNFVLKQSADSEYSHEIKSGSPSSFDVSSKKSPKLVRPIVALKPAITTPPNQKPVQNSPLSPQKNINKGSSQTDKDGYEIPIKESHQLAKKNKKGSNNSYEYEQIDDVMTSRIADKCLGKSNNKISPSEYTLLDKRTVEQGNYQDLISSTECSSSSGNSISSRKSSHHEYETPLVYERKKQTLDRPVYLEILD